MRAHLGGLITFALSALHFDHAYAQQFQGAVIPNSLPSVPGSEQAFWNILDANKKNTTLTTYSSLTTSGTRLTPSAIKRVVIFIHGLDRDPYNYMSNMLSAISQIQGAPDINFSSVQVVCPYFANGDDKNIGYPFNTSAPAGGSGSYTSALVWPGSEWIGGQCESSRCTHILTYRILGALNEYPYKQKTLSNYAVLDQMIQYYDNKTL